MSIQKVDKTTGDVSLICGSTNFSDSPIGTILALMSNNIPTGFLLCDDTAYRASDYPELWAILPSTVKDTVNNTFTIDLRESTLKGTGLTSKSNNHYDSDGLALGEFIDDRIQDHRHSLPLGTASGGDAVMLAQNTLIDNTGTVENDYRKGDTTEVKSVGVNYIIKAKMVALPADLESGVAQIATKYPDYSQSITIDANPWTAPEDCYVSYLHMGSSNQDTIILSIDNNIVTKLQGYNNVWVSVFSGYVKKGQVLQSGSGSTALASRCLAWKLN